MSITSILGVEYSLLISIGRLLLIAMAVLNHLKILKFLYLATYKNVFKIKNKISTWRHITLDSVVSM